MDMRLSHYEISALQSLDRERGPTTVGRREDELPKKLLEFNLVSRQSGGPAVITQSGQRALFRHECVLALEAIGRNEEVTAGEGVEEWLVASGFATPSADAASMAILPRGRLWLKSLAPETVADTPGVTADSFAARRR
jgi:hypothetical protein